MNRLLVESLQSMDQHRTVGFFEHVMTHLDLVVGSNRHQVGVEGRVVKGAQRDSVRHRRRAKRFTITDDVGGLEKLVVPETADGAVTLIRLKYPLSKLLLVQSLLDGSRDVAPTNVSFHRVIRHVPQTCELPLVDGHCECKELRGVADDEHSAAGLPSGGPW
jgi:hypothetical protein